MLGAILTCNRYLGLKSGWTFTANLFGAILGFGVLSLFSKVLPNNLPGFGVGHSGYHLFAKID